MFSFSSRIVYAKEEYRPQLLLYYTPTCPYSMKVVRFLNSIHKKIALVDVRNNPQAKRELIEYGGKSQIPCLFIDEKPLYEADKIIDWLSKHNDLLENT